MRNKGIKLKNIMTAIFILLLVPSFASCGSIKDETNDDTDTTDVVDDSGFVYENEEYDNFFDPHTSIYITMNFTSESLHNLSSFGGSNQDSTLHDIYHPCDVTIKVNEQVYEFKNAGAREKGNSSRRFLFDGEWFNGNYINFSLKFNETFSDGYYKDYKDKSLKERIFLNDMEKVYLKWNKNNDSTFTKELYAQDILENEGIYVQKANICRVTILKDGVRWYGYSDINYHVYESIDKEFLQRKMNIDEAAGDLYKGGASLNTDTLNSIGVEDNSKNLHYTYSLKTNKKTSTHELLKNCIDVVNKVGDVQTVKEQLEATIDIEYLLKYLALMWVIGNPDDMRYNNNNTYFYFNSVSNKLYLIPFDNDSCFGILKDMHYDLSNSDPLDLRNFIGYIPGTYQCESHLLWRVILPADSDNYPVIEEYQNKYLDLCYKYAKQYLNEEAFQNFTSSFALAPSQLITYGGADNDSFVTYARNKLRTSERFESARQ